MTKGIHRRINEKNPWVQNQNSLTGPQSLHQLGVSMRYRPDWQAPSFISRVCK